MSSATRWFFRIGTVLTLTGAHVPDVGSASRSPSRGIGTHLAHHLGLVAELRPRFAARSSSAPGRPVDRPHSRPGDGGRCDRLHRVHGAGAAPVLIQYPNAKSAIACSRPVLALPLKLNTSGVISPIFASSLLLLPTPSPTSTRAGPGWFVPSPPTRHGRPLFPDPLCRAHHLLRLLLYGDRVQPDGNRREPEEARRLHPRDPAGRAYAEYNRLCASRASP